MNWLAHLLLSEPTPEFRVGSLLPDFVRGPVLKQLPAPFQPAIARHHLIDVFTDSHGVFRQSVRRIESPLRRYGAILIDVFYDHFLTCAWGEFSEVPLPEFLREVHASFRLCESRIPNEVVVRLRRMKDENWLGCYGDLSGLTLTLSRMSRRFKRPIDLVPAVEKLEEHYEAFQRDFGEFFPELVRVIRPDQRS